MIVKVKSKFGFTVWKVIGEVELIKEKMFSLIFNMSLSFVQLNSFSFYLSNYKELC